MSAEGTEVAESRTFLIGLIGENVAGSLTPAMLESEGKRQGIPLVYRPLDPNAMKNGGADWPRLVERALDFGFDGLNVTHPAKQLVQPVLDELDEDASLLGAVNTIDVAGGRLIGRNTDYRGFGEALDAIGVDPADGEVIQIGAGGAGSAIAYALLKAGVPKLSIADIDRGSTDALIRRLSSAFDTDRMQPVSPDVLSTCARDAVGVVNATPIGMTGVSDGSPFPLEALHPGLWVGDAVYRPRHTALVRAAAELGCAAFGGTRMAVGQAAAAFSIFTGAQADPEAMLATFEARAAAEAAR